MRHIPDRAQVEIKVSLFTARHIKHGFVDGGSAVIFYTGLRVQSPVLQGGEDDRLSRPAPGRIKCCFPGTVNREHFIVGRKIVLRNNWTRFQFLPEYDEKTLRIIK